MCSPFVTLMQLFIGRANAGQCSIQVLRRPAGEIYLHNNVSVIINGRRTLGAVGYLGNILTVNSSIHKCTSCGLYSL